METEAKIVYSIIETVEKGTLSDDIKIDERIVKAFYRKYRASVIAEYSMKGMTISDECFQDLGLLQFNYLSSKQFTRELPKIIRLQSNFGLFFEKNGENVPVVNSEEYTLGMKNIINSKLPKAKFLGTKATIYIGNRVTMSCGPKPKNNNALNDFINETRDNNNTSVTVNVFAVLDNPDDCPGYDWTLSVCPTPSEINEEITTRILRKEYNIILNVKSDKITDGNQPDITSRQASPD